ncbi:MAG TPA: tetratricopeptide repeat protein [Candidatus Nitrosocosmicus sp.]|nr:tetratricopeptide repeat protein [Candidatus Nitrosocosmicus sp.]
MDKNYKINKTPKTIDGENNNSNLDDSDQVKKEIGPHDNSVNDRRVLINKNSYEMPIPELQDAFGEITEILNEKLRSVSLSSEYKNSIEERIEELGLLMKSIPSNNLGSPKPNIEPPLEKIEVKPTADINTDDILQSDKAIEINPQYADAYNNKGLSLYYLGNNQEAIACYDKAIESNPYFADAFFNKGMSLSALSKFPEAIASFDKTLEIDSEHVKALNGKAWIMASHFPNRLTEALEIIKRALGIDPTDIDVLYTYGFILENLGSYQESLSIYRHILKQDPLIPEVWYRCFVSKTKTSDSESSDSSFYLKQAIDLNPDYAELSRADEQKKITEREVRFSIPFMGI